MPSSFCLGCLAALTVLAFQGVNIDATCPAESAEQTKCDRVDEVRVQLRWLKTGQFAGFYAAEEQGYYAQECLRVVLLERTNVHVDPETSVVDNVAHFATPWAIRDIELRSANLTSFKTVAQVFRRPGYQMMVGHFSALAGEDYSLSSLEDVRPMAKRLGRPVRISATDDSYPLFARLLELGLRMCGPLKWPRRGNTTCVPGDEVELIWGDFNSGVRSLKVPESDDSYADLQHSHVNQVSNILRAELPNGDLIGTTARVPLMFALGGVKMQEDGICASEKWLAQPGSQDITRRFLRATMRGWIFCRDSPYTCAKTLTPKSDVLLDNALFQVLEVNKLIWPSPDGVGMINEHEVGDMYDWAASSGLYPAIDPAPSLEPNIMMAVKEDLQASGEDVYGQFYSAEEFQTTLSFCRENATSPVALCTMYCKPGSQPPETGGIFGPEQCVFCGKGSASPGGRAPCTACTDDNVAPSPGMAFCLPPSATSPELIAGLACAGALVVVLLLVGCLLWRRSKQLKDELHSMHSTLSTDRMDMESPLVKALSFLDDVENGKYNHVWQPWKKNELHDKAQEMRLLLLHSRSLTQPDVEKEMRKEGEYGNDIVNFVVQNTVERESHNFGVLYCELAPGNMHREESADIGTPQLPAGILNRLSGLGLSFDVDILSMYQEYPSGLLGYVLEHFIRKWNLFDELSLSSSSMRRFATVIEMGHFDNPYHNLAHTIDVTARLGTILEKSGLARSLVLEHGFDGCLTLLGAIISAVVHDFQHLGVSNQFVINAEMDASIKFNDQSCLENQALLEALANLMDPEHSFLMNLPKPNRRRLRGLIIKMVLATDMSKHFSILTSVQAKVLDQHEPLSGEQAARGKSRFGSLGSEQLNIVLQLFLKAADLGHCGLPIKSHLEWVSRVQEEFWNQGDKEKAAGLPQTPLSDRTKPGALWGTNQVGFFKALVCPLYDMLAAVAPECHELQSAVNGNLAFWKANPGSPPSHLMNASALTKKHGIYDDDSAHGPPDSAKAPLLPLLVASPPDLLMSSFMDDRAE